MKIQTISDIHGDFETLDKALKVYKDSDAQLLTINGDLLGEIFKDKEREDFLQTSSAMYNFTAQLYNASEGRISSMNQAAQVLSSGQVEVNEETIALAKKYLSFEETAKTRATLQYQEYKTRFDSLGKKVLLVPGNWDLLCLEDVLANENLHMKPKVEIEGLSFIGYGGAGPIPKPIPQDLGFVSSFNSDEAFNHLSSAEDTDVALVHVAPRYFDNPKSTSGEFFMLAYMYRNQPSVILAGHTHHPSIMIEKRTNTVIINPGNLGRYDETDYGTFLQFELDENPGIKKPVLYNVSGDKIKFKNLIS
jgi:Icc-related predicted phosphoesterase